MALRGRPPYTDTEKVMDYTEVETAKQTLRDRIYEYAQDYAPNLRVLIDGTRITLESTEPQHRLIYDLDQNEQGGTVIRGILTECGQKLITDTEGDPASRLAIAFVRAFVATLPTTTAGVTE